MDPATGREGLMGARLGAADNATTGRFAKQGYELIERMVAPDNPASSLDSFATNGVRFVGTHHLVATGWSLVSAVGANGTQVVLGALALFFTLAVEGYDPGRGFWMRRGGAG